MLPLVCWKAKVENFKIAEIRNVIPLLPIKGKDWLGAFGWFCSLCTLVFLWQPVRGPCFLRLDYNSQQVRLPSSQFLPAQSPGLAWTRLMLF